MRLALSVKINVCMKVESDLNTLIEQKSIPTCLLWDKEFLFISLLILNV